MRSIAKLEEQAAKLREKAEQRRAAQSKDAREQRARLEEYDRKALDRYDPAKWERRVEEAREEFVSVVLEEPWARAWVDYVKTYYLSHEAVTEAENAANRLGEPRTFPRPPAALTGLIEQLTPALEERARQAVAKELEAEREHRSAHAKGDRKAE